MITETNEPQSTERQTAPPASATEPPSGSTVGGVARQIARARIGRVPVGGLLAAVAIAGLLGTAYNIGTPTAGAALDAGRMPMAAGAPVSGGFAPTRPAAARATAQEEAAKLNGLQLAPDTGTTTTTGDRPADRDPGVQSDRQDRLR